MNTPSARGADQTVFIVDDDPSVAEGLSELFLSTGIAAQTYASAEDFLEFCDASLSGCLLLDVRLPGMSGLELQTHLAHARLPLPLIIMTAHGDIPMVRKALKGGAVEFLTKPFQEEELLLAVEQAFAQDREQRAAREASESVLERWQSLSERERQVMELVTAGLLNKQIADRLFLSIVTIKLYRKQVMQKMGADSVADLVRMWEKVRTAL